MGRIPPTGLIIFFELLWTYIGARLWTPSRLGNNDLIRLAIPIVADNLGNDCIRRKHYAKTRPASLALQESAAHSLTGNTTIVPKHMGGRSGKLSIWAEKISRNPHIPIGGAKQRAPDWEGPKFRRTDISEKSEGGLKVTLFIKDRKCLTKSPPSKGEAISKA